MNILMRLVICLALTIFSLAVYAQSNNKGATPVEVENGPNNPVPVGVANDETNPVPVRSVVRRIPVLCVFPQFSANGQNDAIACVTPTGLAVSPVPPGYFLAITDIIATSQLPTGSSGQALVRVSSRLGGTKFGAGVPMMLKPGETQSLHYQSPHQVLPVGRIPVATVATNFGNVYPVDVNVTGYLVAVDDLGR